MRPSGMGKAELCEIKASGSYEIRFHPAHPPAKEVKEIGGKWHKRMAYYTLPPLVSSLENLFRLYGKGAFEIAPKLEAWYNEPFGFPMLIRPGSELGEDLYRSLHPWQKEAMHYLVNNPHRASLVALAPALGKTSTAIASAIDMGFNRALFVVPAFLIPTWQEEARTRFGFEFQVNRQEPPARDGWVLTNYETVTKRLDEYDQGWDLVCADESIMLMSRDSARSKALATLRERALYMWELSGSPISKHADDLWMQFHIMQPKSFPSYWRFVNTYCLTTESKYGTKIIGTRKTINLTSEFRDIMFVRSAEDVAPDLPELPHEVIHCELSPTQQRVFTGLKDNLLAFLEEGVEEGELVEVSSVLAKIIKMQQAVSNLRNFGDKWPAESGKLEVLRGMLKNNLIAKPCIIWVHWRETAKQVAEQLKQDGHTVGLIAGGKTFNAKQKELELYKAGKLDCLVLSLGVGKYGISLGNSRSAVYYDKTWDADAYVQSLARVHPLRVRAAGFSHVPNLYTLKVPHTTDDLIADALRDKSFSISRVSRADLATLIRGL